MASAAIGAMLFVIFISFAIGLLIAILFLLNLQNTLKAASQENRKLPPVNVWLLLIPIFNIYYTFVVVKRITATIQAEYASKGQALDNPKPTYNVGMAMAVGSVVSMLISILTYKETFGSSMATYSASTSGNYEELAALQSTSPSMLSNFGSFVGLAVFILWIVYWVQTAGYKNKMKSLPNNKSESEIFGQF